MNKVLRAKPDPKAMWVPKARRATKGFKALRARLDLKVKWVPKAHRATKGFKVSEGFKELKVSRGFKVNRVSRVPKVFRVNEARKVSRESVGYREPKDLKANKDPEERKDLRGFKGRASIWGEQQRLGEAPLLIVGENRHVYLTICCICANPMKATPNVNSIIGFPIKFYMI